MTDLVEFLQARLDEDEEFARDAYHQRWMSEENFVESLSGSEVARFEFATDARHAGGWDPARVLADVAAKRAVIELHTLTISKRDDVPPFDPITGKRNEDEFDVRCALCDWVSWNPTSGCATLLALAAPFRDHPDFDPAWENA